MPEATTATTANIVPTTSNPAGDLTAELKNLLDWTDETENARVTVVCTFTTACCQQW